MTPTNKHLPCMLTSHSGLQELNRHLRRRMLKRVLAAGALVLGGVLVFLGLK